MFGPRRFHPSFCPLGRRPFANCDGVSLSGGDSDSHLLDCPRPSLGHSGKSTLRPMCCIGAKLKGSPCAVLPPCSPPTCCPASPGGLSSSSLRVIDSALRRWADSFLGWPSGSPVGAVLLELGWPDALHLSHRPLAFTVRTSTRHAFPWPVLSPHSCSFALMCALR